LRISANCPVLAALSSSVIAKPPLERISDSILASTVPSIALAGRR